MKLRLLCLLLALANVSTSQEPNSPHNGRWWKSLSEDSRLYYLVGLLDGISAADGPAINAEIFFSNATMGEAVAGIDQIYSQPENALVGISSALVIFQMKVHGARPVDVESRLAVARRAASARSSPSGAPAKKTPAKEEPFKHYDDAKKWK